MIKEQRLNIDHGKLIHTDKNSKIRYYLSEEDLLPGFESIVAVNEMGDEVATTSYLMDNEKKIFRVNFILVPDNDKKQGNIASIFFDQMSQRAISLGAHIIEVEFVNVRLGRIAIKRYGYRTNKKTKLSYRLITQSDVIADRILPVNELSKEDRQLVETKFK